MAFNIMNVSNIETTSNIGYVFQNSVTLIPTVPANTLIKIKSAAFLNRGTTYSGFYLEINRGGTILRTEHISAGYAAHGGGGYTDPAPLLKDFYLNEGESLRLDQGTYGGTSGITYIVNYEIWT